MTPIKISVNKAISKALEFSDFEEEWKDLTSYY